MEAWYTHSDGSEHLLPCSSRLFFACLFFTWTPLNETPGSWFSPKACLSRMRGEEVPEEWSTAPISLRCCFCCCLTSLLGVQGVAGLCPAVPAALSSYFPHHTCSEDPSGLLCRSQSRAICGPPPRQCHWCLPSSCGSLELGVHLEIVPSWHWLCISVWFIVVSQSTARLLLHSQW